MNDRRNDQQKNEGEGNKTAARHYNQATTEFAKSGKAESGAEAAKKAVSGPERTDLEAAEKIAKAHAKGEDPAVTRKQS